MPIVINNLFGFGAVRSPDAKEARILFRFYEIPDRALADRISVNTNSQSAVKPRDLRSNDKVMVGLKGRLKLDIRTDSS